MGTMAGQPQYGAGNILDSVLDHRHGMDVFEQHGEVRVMEIRPPTDIQLENFQYRVESWINATAPVCWLVLMVAGTGAMTLTCIVLVKNLIRNW
jgi:hypothetical protein